MSLFDGIFNGTINGPAIGKHYLNYSGAEVVELQNLSVVHQAGSLFLGKSRKQGHLFITVSHGENIWRFSNEMLDGGNYLWDQKIINLPSIQFQAKEKGGYVALNWGNIQFLTDAFSDAEGNILAPPDEVLLKAEWGSNDTPGRLKTVFEGEAYLRAIQETSLLYDLFEQEFKSHALAEGISSSASTTFLITDITDLGGGLVECTTGIPHAFEFGDEVVLQAVDNTSNFADTAKYKILAIDVANSKFTISLPNFGGYSLDSAECSQDITPIPIVVGSVSHVLPLRTGFGDSQSEWKFYRPNFVGTAGAGLDFYDDSVSITSNFTTDDLQNRYLETSTAVIGQLSTSGTANMASLLDLFTWACGVDQLNLTLHNLDAAEAIPLSFIQKEQMLLIDLLDQVAGYCSYQFYIQGGMLYLMDKASGHGSIGELTEEGLFMISIKKEMPTKTFKANWESNQAGTLRKDSVSGFPTLQQVKEEVTLSGSSSLGDVRSYQVFDQNKLAIKTKLQALKLEREKLIVEAETPLEGLPVIGNGFSYLDTNVTPNKLYQVIITDLSFNFEAHTIKIKGKGFLQ